MDRNKIYKYAGQWLEKYKKQILPCIKSNVVYSPSDVAYLLDQVADLTLFILFYDMTENLTDQEITMKNTLEKVSEEINNVLTEKDAELDQLNNLADIEELQDDTNEMIS